MKYSIVIPGYNEEAVIKDSITKLDSYLRKNIKKYEIIYSDDGSTDQSVKIAKSLTKKIKQLRVLRNRHKGPGNALKQAFIAANGDTVAYIDADLSFNLKVLLTLMQKVEGGYDIAVASKQQTRQRNYPLVRRMLSKSYHTAVHIMLGIKVDTQCGCKAFNRERLMRIMRHTKENGWVWETEVISVASLKKYKITQVSATVIDHGKRPSNVGVSHVIDMGTGILRVLGRRATRK